jgi:hypothetical protein
MQIRGKEKLEEMRQHYEEELCVPIPLHYCGRVLTLLTNSFPSRRDTPLEAQKVKQKSTFRVKTFVVAHLYWLLRQQEIDRLKETQQETLKLVYTAGDAILDLLQVSLRKADHNVQSTLAPPVKFSSVGRANQFPHLHSQRHCSLLKCIQPQQASSLNLPMVTSFSMH